MQITVQYKKEDIRLSYPYATNCTDYLRLWHENNGSGPLNERACIEYCKLEKLKLEGECIDEYVWYAPHHEELCDMNEKTTTNEMIKDCGSKCQPACREQTYDVKYDEIEFSTRLVDCSGHLPAETAYRG
ncbi:uncharacterized protein [Parasteatoda tepidariorum]|uniref:uncharacterized protein n=1 Tax=Parasteatoda tepidariorum TaxID=114398 RepID=UPI0039BD86C8